jgi:hypothetical protein
VLGELRQSNWSANTAGLGNGTEQASGQGELARALAKAM